MTVLENLSSTSDMLSDAQIRILTRFKHSHYHLFYYYTICACKCEYKLLGNSAGMCYSTCSARQAHSVGTHRKHRNPYTESTTKTYKPTIQNSHLAARWIPKSILRQILHPKFNLFSGVFLVPFFGSFFSQICCRSEGVKNYKITITFLFFVYFRKNTSQVGVACFVTSY